MNVIVHRGTNQIGGSVIEVSSKLTRIILDAGSELEAVDNVPLPHVSGLFDAPGYDAVFFSHNHLDHIGLAHAIHQDIPLYMGKKALSVMQAMANYLGKPLGFTPKPYEAGISIMIGDMKVTPFLVDHSAFDSYMILVEAEGESILYTGDFRSTGRKPFELLLKHLPKKTDILICEGTNLGYENKPSISEQDLEEQAVELFRSHFGPVFILQASTNIDRIVTMYRAAKRSGRVFLEDLFMAEVARAAAPSIPNPSFEDVRVFLDRHYDAEHYRYKLFDGYGTKKIARTDIPKKPFVLCIRTSMGGLLKSLSQKMSFEEGLMVYSMWNGYKAKPDSSRFLELGKTLGLKEVTLHNSGHADADTIELLVSHVRPSVIIPVHTENSSWWKEKYPGQTIRNAGEDS